MRSKVREVFLSIVHTACCCASCTIIYSLQLWPALKRVMPLELSMLDTTQTYLYVPNAKCIEQSHAASMVLGSCISWQAGTNS